MKIITLTINPAIDKSSTVKAIIPDSKLRCSTPIFEPGGGGINVSRALSNLEQDSLAVYLAGGPNGQKMQDLLDAEKITQKVIPTQNNTRENFIVVDGHNQQFRFGMPGYDILEQEWQNCLSFFKNLESDTEMVVASGSVAPGIPVDFYARLAKILKEKNIKLVLDCGGVALTKTLEVGAFCIKPNLHELAQLTGHEEIDDDQVEEMALELINSGKVEMVVVSMGPHGALLASKDGFIHAIPPSVKRVSTVGAGDSMVAGIVYATTKGLSPKEIITYGVACGTASTINPGTELCLKNDVNYIIKKVSYKQRS